LQPNINLGFFKDAQAPKISDGVKFYCQAGAYLELEVEFSVPSKLLVGTVNKDVVIETLKQQILSITNWSRTKSPAEQRDRFNELITKKATMRDEPVDEEKIKSIEAGLGIVTDEEWGTITLPNDEAASEYMRRVHDFLYERVSDEEEAEWHRLFRRFAKPYDISHILNG